MANDSAPTITGVGMVLTIADPESRADFADRINIGLKESATNTTIDGFATFWFNRCYYNECGYC